MGKSSLKEFYKTVDSPPRRWRAGAGVGRGFWHQVGLGLATLHEAPDNTIDALALSLLLSPGVDADISPLTVALPRAAPVIGIQILPGWNVPSPFAEKHTGRVHLSTL